MKQTKAQNINDMYVGTPFNLNFGEKTYNYDYDPVSHPTAVFTPTFHGNVLNGFENFQHIKGYGASFVINHVLPYQNVVNTKFNQKDDR